MRIRSIATAVLALGLSGFAATSASANDRSMSFGGRYERNERNDRGRYDRDHDRYDRDRGSSNESISLREVPGRVLATVHRVRRGHEIETARFIRYGGRAFYQFRIEGHRNEDAIVRVSPDGQLLGVQEVEDWDRDYRNDCDRHGR